MTFSIPDLSDAAKRALLPPSPHKPTAIQLLLGCAQIHDPLALKHLLTAVYFATHAASPLPAAREMASHVPRAAIPALRRDLEQLNPADPEALTLLGLFLEAENHPARARNAYQAALDVEWVYAYNPHARHPAQLPIPPPWIALGYLLRGGRDEALARGVFERGAREGDDPLACWEYASYLEKEGERGEWLKYASKAAASGQRDAMLGLARFYRGLGTPSSPSPSSSDSSDSSSFTGVRGQAADAALQWLRRWRPGSALRLAREWYQAAGNAGQKEALMELAEWCSAEGEGAKATSLLEKIAEPVEARGEEEFPEVVLRARRMLAGLKV